MKKIAFCAAFLFAHLAAFAAATITFTDTGNSVKMTNTAAFSLNLEFPYNSVIIQLIPIQGGTPSHLTFTRLDGSHIMDIFHADVLSPSTANVGALQVALAAMFYKPLGGSGGSVSVSNFPNPQAISASALPLPSGAAAESTLSSLLSELQTKTEPSNTQQVAGTVGINNFPASQAVEGTVSIDNFPATQAVSGSVGVSNFPSSQTVSGSVSITGTPTVTISGGVGITPTIYSTSITQLTAAGTQSGAFDVSNAKTGTVVYKCASLPALGIVGISLEGSNNGTDWATIESNLTISIANANLVGSFKWSNPYQYVRVNFISETLGTSTTVDASIRASN